MNRNDMTPEQREACDLFGIEFDADGFPVLEAVPGPPRPCARCGALTERPSEFGGHANGRAVSGVQCFECARLAQTDLRAWGDGFKGEGTE